MVLAVTDEVGRLIAGLAPDVPWVDDLRVPTAGEIRERVRRFTPEEREVAERDALRAEGWDGGGI